VRSQLVDVEDFGQGRPMFASGCCCDGDLHGVHDLPPALGLGVGCHLAHVGCVVRAVVFEVGEEGSFAQEDGVVADVAVCDGFEHCGPYVSVVADVFGFILGAQVDDLSVAAQRNSFWPSTKQYLI
jgi:hypothetical protein